MPELEIRAAAGRILVAATVAEWQRLRAQIAEIERAEHPDITDSYGRVWTWFAGEQRLKYSDELYVHCGMVASTDPDSGVYLHRHGLPTQAALDNQNYELCEICLDGRTRNVRPCKPEWGCCHPICARMNGTPAKTDCTCVRHRSEVPGA